MMADAYDTPTSGSTLHEDAAVAAIAWARLLPTSFTGSAVCGGSPRLSDSVMSRSLALIHSTSSNPFAGALDMADVWEMLVAYDENLLNWIDVFEALRSTFQ
jgi:hypothetical protein